MRQPKNPHRLNSFFFFFPNQEFGGVDWHNCDDPQAILEYGQELLGHSLKELHPNATINSGKGGLGNAVEKYHYGYEPNSDSEPDFAKAGLELKVTPLTRMQEGSFTAKERLVLNIIDYEKEATSDFETSSFWKKNKLLLLMFYLHEAGYDPVDMIFKLIRTWKFPADDLKIIREDWAVLHEKMKSGRAHEISEGDTFYLAACMKGSRAGAQMREQYGSNIPAQQRAYSLKNSYMNQILLESYLDSAIKHELEISDKRIAQLKKAKAEKAVKSVRSYKAGETFEQLIERRFKPYYGKTVAQIEKHFKTTINPSAKDFASTVCRTILGVKSRKIEEFEKAGVLLKAVQLEANRNYIVESMSFPYMRYTEVANQEWEDSDWYKVLHSKFLFAVFRKSSSTDKKKLKLEKVFFWNMPLADMPDTEALWLDTKNKILAGDYNNFITTKTHPICHIRPHGTDSNDLTPTPQGTKEKKYCFWLNNDYILDVVKKNCNLE